MRIISDFKDYYDCLMRHDDDRQTVYLRKTRIIQLKHDPCPYKLTIISFCGHIVPCTEVNDWHSLSPPPNNRPAYTFDEAEISQRVTWPKFQRSLSDCIQDSVEHVRHFYAPSTPIWLVESMAVDHPARLIENPRLSPYHFARVMPIHQAYQELVMWF